MSRIFRRGTLVLAACGACACACAVALGVLLLPSSTPASPPALNPAAAVTAGSSASATATSGAGAASAIDPAIFSPGACMSFPPTSGDRHETVFLDAGHGGADPGAVGSTESGTTIDEAPINLAIELGTMAILRAEGYRVVVSRTENTTVTRLTSGDLDGGILSVQGAHNDVAARDVCANLAKANVLVGIYMDAGDPWNAGSITGYDQDRPFSAENLRLADLLQKDVLGAMNAQGWNIPDDGVQSDSGLGSAVSAAAEAYGHLMLLGPAETGYFSTPSQMPGALIEPLYLTDPFEGSIAASTHGQQVIASALADAINQYFTGS